MNWILLATPIAGALLMVIAVGLSRKAFPVKRVRVAKPTNVDDAVSKTATMIATAVGAAMRDERKKGIDLGLEDASANYLDSALSPYRRKAS